MATGIGDEVDGGNAGDGTGGWMGVLFALRSPPPCCVTPCNKIQDTEDTKVNKDTLRPAHEFECRIVPAS